MSTTTTQNYPSIFALNTAQQAVYEPALTNASSSPSPKLSPAPTPPKRSPTDSSDCSSSGVSGMNKTENSSEASSMTSDRDSNATSGSHASSSLPPDFAMAPIPPVFSSFRGGWPPPPTHLAHAPPTAPGAARPHPPPPYFTMACHTVAETSSGAAALRSASTAGNSLLPNGAVTNPLHQAASPPTSVSQNPASPMGQVLPQVPPPVGALAGVASNGDNDLFVHVQPGESLMLCVGQDYQQIVGPATIRMVGQANISNLPLHVPHGHLLQQIVDEQGAIKHLILSPENPRTMPVTSINNVRPATANTPLSRPATTGPTSFATASSPAAKSVSPTAAASPNDNETTPTYSRNKKAIPSKRPGTNPLGTSNDTNGTLPENDGIDSSDERDRLKEGLNRIHSPTITRVGTHDVDVHWQELDVSEAGASGGPFPQIDPSEFIYDIFLYEHAANGKLLTKTRCPQLSNFNGLRLSALKPRTNYFVAIRASLPERQLVGQQSRATAFRTMSVPPEPPTILRVMNRGPVWVTFSWNTPMKPGMAPVTHFVLQMSKGKNDHFETVYDGPYDNVRIHRLEPATMYKARVAAHNEAGRSDFSPVLHVHTTAPPPPPPPVLPTTSSSSVYCQPNPYHHQHNAPPHFVNVMPQKLPAPTVATSSARQIRLTWPQQTSDVFANITLEYTESLRGNNYTFLSVPAECYQQNSATVTNLKSNREYRFRLVAQTLSGELVKSEVTVARTHKDRYENSAYYGQQGGYNAQERERLVAPAVQRVYEDENVVELTWKHSAAEFDTLTFVVEGAVSPPRDPNADVHPEVEWRTLYKGQNTVASINDSQLNLFRIQAVNKRGVTSPWSERLYVRRQTQRSKRHNNPPPPRQHHVYVNQQQNHNPSHLSTVANVPPPRVHMPTTQQPTPKPIVAEAKAEEPPRVPTPEPIVPPTCTQPHFGAITSSSIHVSWSLENAKKEEKRPTSLLYELQRVDKEPRVVYSGEQTKYQLENLRPVENVQLRVRSIIVDNEGQRIAGEWSPISSASTPFSVTSPPQNLRLKDNEAPLTLIWDCPAQTNGSDVIEYLVSSANDPQGPVTHKLQLIASVVKTEFVLENALPAHSYLFVVAARNEAGSSEPSNQLEFNSPAAVPGAPQDVEVKASALETLHVSWHPAQSNGADIEAYKVTLLRGKTVVASQQLADGSLEHVFEDLEPNTEYNVEVTAHNRIGWGKVASASQRTLDVPPEPPVLSVAQIASNSLKLKWTSANPSTSEAFETLYFYLEKESEGGKFLPVYEGENRSAKVRGLKESSQHRFRIRAAHARGSPNLAGPWSSISTFQTSAPPPPAIKNAPIVTEVGSGIFQMEWQPVKLAVPTTADESLFYRLQVALKMAKAGAESWKTIYEGPATAYTWTMPMVAAAVTGNRQARVIVVLYHEGEEVASLPSAAAVFSTSRSPSDSPRKRPKAGGNELASSSSSSARTGQAGRLNGTQPPRVGPPAKLSLSKRCKKVLAWARRSIPEMEGSVAVVVAFILVGLLLAFVLSCFFF